MLELGGQQPSNAMVAMNQLTAGGQYLATVNSVNRRRRKKASGVPNPKRMFEEVQAYLDGIFEKNDLNLTLFVQLKPFLTDFRA